MTEQRIILNRLLDKYENSKHLSSPGTSLRRVMLKVEKKDFPEYIYEDAAVRDSYNEAAKELEKQHLVQLEWVNGLPLLSAIVLRLDQIMQNFYTNAPDGIIGIEDCGQMSAWYVMSALGFYQIAPGIPVYTLGRPMIDKALIHVKGGIFEILVKNNSAANKYIKEVKLNGKILDTLFISHTDIIKGGKLEFIMTDQPVK